MPARPLKPKLIVPAAAQASGSTQGARWAAACIDYLKTECHLAANSTTIVKLFLHISRDEQRRRFQKRLENPEKHWKWSSADLEARAKWADYRAAYTDALARCSTAAAPWFVVPADKKWYRDLAVAEILAETARAMNPQWPEPEEDVSGIVIPE